jgi:hypothetical protein
MQERLSRACDAILEKQSDETDARRWRGLTRLVRASISQLLYFPCVHVCIRVWIQAQHVNTLTKPSKCLGLLREAKKNRDRAVAASAARLGLVSTELDDDGGEPDSALKYFNSGDTADAVFIVDKLYSHLFCAAPGFQITVPAFLTAFRDYFLKGVVEILRGLFTVRPVSRSGPVPIVNRSFDSKAALSRLRPLILPGSARKGTPYLEERRCERVMRSGCALCAISAGLSFW